MSGATGDALRHLIEGVVETHAAYQLHLEGVLHLLAFVCAFGVVVVGLDNIRSGGLYGGLKVLAKEAHSKLSEFARERGFDEKTGWPDVIVETIDKYHRAHGGVIEIKYSSLVVIEYFLLNKNNARKYGAFCCDVNLVDKSIEKENIKYLSYLYNTGRVDCIKKLTLVSIIIFVLTCIVSVFEHHISSYMQAENVNALYLLCAQLLIIAYAVFTFFYIAITPYLLAKHDEGLNKKLNQIIDQCAAAFKLIKISVFLGDNLKDIKKGLPSHKGDVSSVSNEKPDLPSQSNGAGSDDLTLIRGITKETELLLNRNRINSFDQISKWSSEDIKEINKNLNLRGNITRFKWVKQAQEFMRK